MTRSQAADLECAARLNSLINEVKSIHGRLWASRFISKQERDELTAFLKEVEEAMGRLVLRSGLGRETECRVEAAEDPPQAQRSAL